MEQFPKANYSPETQAANKQFEDQANARNARRSFLDKLTGKNKVPGFEILKEEATQANALVDKRREEESAYGMPMTSHQDAADEILRGEEFSRSPNDTNFEEMLQVKYPLIAQSIKENIFNSAVRQTREASNNMGSAEAETFEEGVHKLMRGRIDSMIRANDITGMRMLLESNEPKMLADMGIAPFLLRMPRELIFSQAYLLSAINIAHYALEDGIHTGNNKEIEEYLKLKEFLTQMKEAQGSHKA